MTNRTKIIKILKSCNNTIKKSFVLIQLLNLVAGKFANENRNHKTKNSRIFLVLEKSKKSINVCIDNIINTI